MINGGADLYGASRIMLQIIEILKSRKIVLIVPKEGLLTQLIKTDKMFSHVQVYIMPSSPVIYRKMGIGEGLRLLQKMIAFRKKIRKIIKEHEINWAYVNTLSCLFAVPPLKLQRVKVFLHVHEILENDRTLTRYINKLALKWCDKIIAVSEPVMYNLLEAGISKNAKKITTVLNGIPDKYRPETVQLNGACKTITLIGRIKPEKGIWFFLDTISLLPDEIIKKSRFIIIGGTAPGGEHFLEKLQQDIAQHPAKNNIEYHSFTPDITNALNASDIIVVPSLMKDPFPTTILEGLSAGKPVVATNTGGSVQSVRDGETGFLIEPSDKIKFAECLKKLIESDSLRTKIGMQAREEFLEKFTLQIFETNFIKQVNEFEKAIAE
jgi:glycosyltransferase involved in cell wall biosynthesis